MAFGQLVIPIFRFLLMVVIILFRYFASLCDKGCNRVLILSSCSCMTISLDILFVFVSPKDMRYKYN